MKHRITDSLQALRQTGAKGFAVLIDPDKLDEARLAKLASMAEACAVDYFLVGGSLLTNTHIHKLVPSLKSQTDIPVVLFPGGIYQIVPEADGILFLSLISGRNPDLLIGKQVEAAPMIRQTDLEVIPTGYMLIESGKTTTANYISNTLPIPRDKPDIALCTALAGVYLGLQVLYMDGGSGAARPISTDMIHAVSSQIDQPLIVGGGIRSAEDALRIWEAGADLIVIGNAIEKDPEGRLMQEIAAARDQRRIPKRTH